MAEINEREFSVSDKDALIISGLKDGDFKILLNSEGLPLITKDTSKDGFSCLIHFDGLNPFNLCSLNNELTFGKQDGELFRAFKKEPVYTGSFVKDVLNILTDANRKPISVKNMLKAKMEELHVSGISVTIVSSLCSKREDKLLCKGWARNEDGKRRPSKFWVDADDEYRNYKIDWVKIESVDDSVAPTAPIN